MAKKPKGKEVPILRMARKKLKYWPSSHTPIGVWLLGLAFVIKKNREL